jgi:hypothetical protein
MFEQHVQTMKMLARRKISLLPVLIAGVAFWCLPVASASADLGVKVTVHNGTDQDIAMTVNLLAPGRGREYDSVGRSGLFVEARGAGEVKGASTGLGIALVCRGVPRDGLVFVNPFHTWPWVDEATRDQLFQTWRLQGHHKNFFEGEDNWFWDRAIRVFRLDDSDHFKEFALNVREAC